MKMDNIKERIKKIECMYQNAYEKQQFNGGIAISFQGDIRLKKVYGYADADDTELLSTAHRFELASLVKQFTASAILLLESEGKLQLSDTLDKYYPDIPYPGITIYHLLTHTSGLPFLEEAFIEKQEEIDMQKLLEKLMVNDEHSLFLPQAEFCYNNLNYDLLADIIEKVSGDSYTVFITNKLFLPAGMCDTKIWTEDGKQYAIPRYYENGCILAAADSWGGSFGKLFRQLHGSGMLYSTLDDMLNWDRALRKGYPLSRDAQANWLMRTRLLDGSFSSYSLGWNIDSSTVFGSYLYHTGNLPGCLNKFWRFLDTELCVVVLSNEEKEALCMDQLWVNTIALLEGRECTAIHGAKDRRCATDTSLFTLYCGEYEPFVSQKNVRIGIEGGKLYLYDFYHTLCNELIPVGDHLFTTVYLDWDFYLDGKRIVVKDENITLNRIT